MTNSEIKQALLSAAPVRYNGIRYTVAEIVYRSQKGQIIISVGLLDKNGNCLVYARPEKVSVVNE